MKFSLSFSTTLILTILLTACVGDRQTVVGQDLGDTSFVNTNFKGNKIDYSEGMNPCANIDKSMIAETYGLSPDQVYVIEPSANGPCACTYKLMLGGNDFNSLTGSISVFPEIKNDVVQAGAGQGDNWAEAWAIQKAASRSSEFLPDMGMAALWRGSKRTLRIKFEGYVLEIWAPSSAINEAENAKNRDYKAIAIAMAKAAGFL